MATLRGDAWVDNVRGHYKEAGEKAAVRLGQPTKRERTFEIAQPAPLTGPEVDTELGAAAQMWVERGVASSDPESVGSAGGGDPTLEAGPRARMDHIEERMDTLAQRVNDAAMRKIFDRFDLPDRLKLKRTK